MKEYQLLNGRKIFLVRWTLVRTYNEFYEGMKQRASQMIRKDLPEYAARIMKPGSPIEIIDSSNEELPTWLCVAEFRSKSGVQNKNPNFYSELYVCWFMDDTDISLDDIIIFNIIKIDWESLAQDYDVLNS